MSSGEYLVKGPYDFRVILYKSTVEVREPEEDLDIAVALRYRLFLNSSNAFLVYNDTVRGNDEPEEVYLVRIERILR